MDERSTGLGRALIVAAAVAVVLAAIGAAAPVLGPFLMAVAFAFLCRPIFGWLVGRGLPGALALAVIALGLTAVVVGLGLLIGASVGEILANVETYRAQLAERLAGLPSHVESGPLSGGAILGVFVGIVSAIASFALSFFFLLVMTLFLLVDGPRMVERMRSGLGGEHPLMLRLATFGPKVIRYFGLRAYLNLLTGAGVALALWLLDIPYAPLWGVLLFFLSFVPYIGIFVASIPPVFLALVQHGPGRALLVIVGITVINLTLENIVMPRLVGAGLQLAPTVVFLSFFFWTWLLGPAGALLAAFLTVLVIIVLDSYDETRWLAALLSGGGADSAAVREGVAPDPLASDAPVHA